MFLNQATQYALTLVSSLAGSGKTTALVEWAQQLAIPTAWFSIDEGDNDINRFLAYFVSALQNVVPGAGKAVLETNWSSESISVENLVALLVNDLAEAKEDFVLILDDYHLIRTDAVHKAVLLLIEHMPRQMHLVIATRADPNLPLARFRARNRILELRMALLRFTRAEVEEYLNQVMQLALNEEALDILKGRTEGWIAGVQMAALSLRGRPDSKAFIQTFSGSNRYILDYLVEEVLSCQPENVQAFLLKTCILDRMCGALCDAIQVPGLDSPENRTGQEMLESLDRSNLFLIPLDDERRWYRYHHLFTDLLRARLLHAAAGQNIVAYHSQASQWFEQNGFVEDAIRHALAAQDTQRSSRLIEGYAEEAWIHGQYLTLMKWIQALPAELVRSRPWLCLWNARSYSQMGDLEKVQLWIDAAQVAAQIVGDQPEADPSVIIFEIQSMRALLACLYQNYDQAFELSRPILASPPEQHTRTALLARCNIAHGLSSMYYATGELDKAEQHCLETIRFSKEIGFTLRYVHAVNKLAFIYKARGQLHPAQQLLQEAFAYLHEQGMDSFFAVGILFCRQVDLLYEWNKINESRQIITDHLNPEQAGELPYILVDFHNVRARDLLLEQDSLGAERLLSEAAVLAQQTYIWQGLAWQTEALQERYRFKKGETVLAAWQQTDNAPADPSQNAGETVFSGEVRATARARIFMAQGKYQEAISILERLESAAAAEKRNGSRIEICILKAQALQAIGETGPAITALETSLALAQPEGYLRTFLDEGAPLIPLLAMVLQAGPSPFQGYAKLLLAALEKEMEISRPVLKAAGSHKPRRQVRAGEGLIEALSMRELEVLGCMADGLSNSETARRLVIETSTVKRHINNIFAKLGVENRVQALNRANELGLL